MREQYLLQMIDNEGLYIEHQLIDTLPEIFNFAQYIIQNQVEKKIIGFQLLKYVDDVEIVLGFFNQHGEYVKENKKVGSFKERFVKVRHDVFEKMVAGRF